MVEVGETHRGADGGGDGEPDVGGREEAQHALRGLGSDARLPRRLVAERDGRRGEETLHTTGRRRAAAGLVKGKQLLCNVDVTRGRLHEWMYEDCPERVLNTSRTCIILTGKW